nr:hypothetical protein [Tanacetum cinerariifolium]
MGYINIDTFTLEQYMALTQGSQGPSVVKPKISNNVNFEIEGQFMRELRESTIFGCKKDDAYEHVEKMDKQVTFKINRHMDLLEKALIQRAIPGMTQVRALDSIQDMADNSQKWHNRASNSMSYVCNQDMQEIEEVEEKDGELTGEFMKRFIRLVGFVGKKAANVRRIIELLRERGGVNNKGTVMGIIFSRRIRIIIREVMVRGEMMVGIMTGRVAVNALLLGLTAQIINELRQNGAGSNVDAENRIAHIEKLFEVLGCADEFKARLAGYKFEGDALNWWKAFKEAKVGEAYVVTLSWKDFRKAFFCNTSQGLNNRSMRESITLFVRRMVNSLMVNTRQSTLEFFDLAFDEAVQRAVNALLPSLTAQITNEFRQNGAGSNGDQPPIIHTWLERFGKQKPQSFSSVTSPVDAENWIAHTEKLFEVLGCADEFKARLASYKFEGDALNWWKPFKQAKGGEAYVATFSWKDFRKAFFLQYFPRLAGFLEKKAGPLEEQAKHYKWALSDWILDGIVNTKITDVAQVANARRNIKLLREWGGINNKRNHDGDRIQSANKNNNQRGYGQRGNDGWNYDRQVGNSSQRFYQQNRDQQYNRSSGSLRQKKYTDYTSPPPCDT